jgi:hypothetical protein
VIGAPLVDASAARPMFSESSNFAGPAPDGPSMFDEIPALVRADLNADIDRDVLARMRHLARQRRTLRPDITDEEMADYLALAENFPNFARWLGARRGTLESPLRASPPWIVVTLAIVGFLTAMLIVGIAITV